MMDSEAKLIESMADDYSNVLKQAKSMGCNDIRALYNIPLKNMELIVNALDKQIPKQPKTDDRYIMHICPCCNDFIKVNHNYCANCGQRLTW